MKKELTCINCPIGCQLVCEVDHDQVISVKGNNCKRGEEYARQELVEPLRVITSLMKAQGEIRPLSVKTNKPIPKRLYFDCVKTILQTHPPKPIKCGDIVIQNILNTGADVVATQDCI